jgi:hypothetical protein
MREAGEGGSGREIPEVNQFGGRTADYRGIWDVLGDLRKNSSGFELFFMKI